MDKVESIHAIINKYGLGDKLGVARLHKHFEILEDEKVVWFKKDRQYQSEIRKG